jgi:hypothetical protein
VRRLFALMVIVALAAVSVAAADARTFYPNCTSKLRYKPRTLSVFCADGGMQVKRIRWQRWVAAEARGRSRWTYVNDCRPNCAEGHFHRYRVRLVLRRVGTCAANGERIFTRMTVIFVGRKWSGPRQFTHRLACY